LRTANSSALSPRPTSPADHAASDAMEPSEQPDRHTSRLHNHRDIMKIHQNAKKRSSFPLVSASLPSVSSCWRLQRSCASRRRPPTIKLTAKPAQHLTLGVFSRFVRRKVRAQGMLRCGGARRKARGAAARILPRQPSGARSGIPPSPRGWIQEGAVELSIIVRSNAMLSFLGRGKAASCSRSPLISPRPV
jgi:hypothetical protein